MNLFHTHSVIDCVLRNSVSMKSIKIQSYGGGSKFSTNSGSTYLLEKFEIKLKNTFFKTFSAIFIISSGVPSYAETYYTVCEEPLDLQYGIY